MKGGEEHREEGGGGGSLGEELGVAGDYLHPPHVLLVALVLEGGVLQYEGPHVVAEPVGVEVPLRRIQKKNRPRDHVRPRPSRPIGTDDVHSP